MKSLLLGTIIVLSNHAFGQSYTSYFTGNTTDMIVSPTPPGGICMMGGATEHDEAMKWFLERAYSGDVLVLRASGSDGYNNYMYSSLGVNVNSVETIVFNNSSAAFDAYVHDRIEKAEAIWFAGGDQWNYISYWRDTPIDSLVNAAVANRGAVIGGTSAGMAILGGYYFSAENGTVTSAQALANPYATNMTVDSTDFLNVPYLADVITDTHYDDPDRKGRHTAFLARIMQDYGIEAKGIACNEYTAVTIDENGIANVYGDYPNYEEHAYFIRKNCELNDMYTLPEVCTSGQPLTWDYGGILTVYKVPGTMNGANSFNLNDWETGTGGTWYKWSVDTGTFTEITSSQPDCQVSIDEQTKNKLTVSPNPAVDTVEIKVAESGTYAIQIVSIEGKSVHQTTFSGTEYSVNVQEFPAGVYLISISSDSINAQQSFVKE